MSAAPSSPWHNAYSQSFFGELRDEGLNREVLGNAMEGEAVVEGSPLR